MPWVGQSTHRTSRRHGGANFTKCLPRETKTDVADHRHLGCRGANRADFGGWTAWRGTGELVCLDANTEPGMTEMSLMPELAALAGLPFGELIRCLVEDAALNR